MKRSLAAVSLALLGFACSPRACGETKEKPVYRLVSDSQIKFTRPEPRSAECPHASSSRAGRVAVFQHKIRHEGCPVLRGARYAMRSDVIYEADDIIGGLASVP